MSAHPVALISYSWVQAQRDYHKDDYGDMYKNTPCKDSHCHGVCVTRIESMHTCTIHRENKYMHAVGYLQQPEVMNQMSTQKHLWGFKSMVLWRAWGGQKETFNQQYFIMFSEVHRDWERGWQCICLECTKSQVTSLARKTHTNIKYMLNQDTYRSKYTQHTVVADWMGRVCNKSENRKVRRVCPKPGKCPGQGRV